MAGDFEAAAQPVAIEEDSVASRRAKRGKADENLTEKHPLHVTFTVSTHSNGVHKADSPSPPAIGVQISVFFLPRLGIVTVTHMLTDETGLHPAQISDLLADLYPGDSGTESPNPENVLPQKDMFDSIKTGRPYRWAQTVCGLEFPGSKREECGENTFLSDAIGRISDRIRHALTLARLVASLGRHVLPPLLNAPSDLPDASAIQSWSTVADPMLVVTALLFHSYTYCSAPCRSPDTYFKINVFPFSCGPCALLFCRTPTTTAPGASNSPSPRVAGS